MLLVATLFALVLGTAVSAPYSNRQRHQMGSNPLLQNHDVMASVKQGFLCDWCVIGVGDGQAAIRENLNQILGILNRTSMLCEFCPTPDQCSSFFLNDVPAAIDEALAQSPETLCNDAGLCDMNATLPGMVMNNLNSNVARDRVIKNMLKRARMVQQQLIRSILGPNYLCDTCQEFITTARDILLNNETQHEVMNFLGPLCDYMPTEIQADCDQFVQSLSSLMTMVAEDILLNSTCTELGFCQAKKEEPTPDVTDTLGGLPDIMSRFGINLERDFGINLDRDFGIPGIGGNGQGRNPFQIPELPKVEIPGMGRNPFQLPGQGQGRPNQNPFGLPDNWNPFGGGAGTPQQGRPQGRPSLGGQPQPGRGYGQPEPGRGYGQPQPGRGYGRPQQHPSPNQNPRPSKPKPETPKSNPIPDLNLEDIFGKTGIQLPEMPKMPQLNIPGFGRIRIPSFGRRNRRSVLDKVGDKVQDMLPDLLPKDKVHEYVPDPIPDAGIIITEQLGANEDCDICKMAVVAVDTWLQDNAAQIQKMVSQFVLPICTMFPSPMEEDCVSDVSEFVQTFIQILVSKLQPEQICTWLGQCDVTADVPAVPAVPDVPILPTGEAPGVVPTTWPLLP